MRKKVLALLSLFGAAVFCSFSTGCNAVQSYSLQSYQGPLPMSDYRYVNPDAYGVPAATMR